TPGVVTRADLALTKTDGVGVTTALAGGNVTYTLTATNIGPSDELAGVSITDVLPAGTTFVSATANPNGCAYSSGTNTVTCSTTAATIAAGANRSRTITLH